MCALRVERSRADAGQSSIACRVLLSVRSASRRGGFVLFFDISLILLRRSKQIIGTYNVSQYQTLLDDIYNCDGTHEWACLLRSPAVLRAVRRQAATGRPWSPIKPGLGLGDLGRCGQRHARQASHGRTLRCAMQLESGRIRAGGRHNLENGRARNRTADFCLPPQVWPVSRAGPSVDPRHAQKYNTISPRFIHLNHLYLLINLLFYSSIVGAVYG